MRDYGKFIANELFKIAKEHENGAINITDALIRLYGLKVYADKNCPIDFRQTILYISLCTVISITEDMLKNKEQ